MKRLLIGGESCENECQPLVPLLSGETKSVRSEWLCLQPSLSPFFPCITRCPVTLFAHKSLVSDQMRYHPIDIFCIEIIAS